MHAGRRQSRGQYQNEGGMVQMIVIGAGPYGLSIAAHLAQRGIQARVFGQPMRAWREHMPVGMFLKSAPGASNISAPEPGSTLADYCEFAGHPHLVGHDPVPLHLFADYGTWFQQRLVPQLEQVDVVCVASAGRDFDVELSSGEVLRTPSVVVATGHLAYSQLPPELLGVAPDGASPDAPVSHASQHPDFARYAGKRVAVIGSGQSALESAVLLHETGAHVELIARAERLLWASIPQPRDETGLRRLVKPPSELGPGWSHRTFTDAPDLVRLMPARARLFIMRTTLGPSGSFWLRDRFEGRFPIRLGRSIQSATVLSDGAVRLELARAGLANETVETDHVLAGTGYRVDIGRLGFLDPAVRARVRLVAGAPALDGTFESSVPGLYFTGLTSAPTFGPLLRFVAGTRFAAPRIAAALAAGHQRSAARQRWAA